MKTLRAIAILALVAPVFGACDVVDWHFSAPSTADADGAPPCTPGATRACYDGPAGTEGRGICKAGTQTCAADGLSWGSCANQVLPRPEDCAAPEDEDCDGKAPPCSGNLLWAKAFGSSGTDHAAGVAVDPSENVLVTGTFSGSIDFGGATLTSAGSTGAFVAKLDSAGGHIWSKHIGAPSSQITPAAIAVDASGSVFITGTFSGSIDFGGVTLTSTGSPDAFVAKLDASGAHVWSKHFGAPSSTLTPSAIAVDAAGDVLVTGGLFGSVDFGGGPVTSAGGFDVFVVELDASGAHLWSKSFGDAGYQMGVSIAADHTGGAFILGNFGSSIDLGGGSLTSAGAIDVFLAKLDASGNHAWSRSYGAAGLQYSASIAVGADGTPIATGYFGGSVGFGGNSLLTTSASAAVFVAKLDADGKGVWQEGFGNTGDQRPTGAAVDGLGHVVICGGFVGQVDFGGGSPIASIGGTDAFVAKFGASGAFLWNKRFGDASEQVCTGVAVDASRSVVIAGDFAGSLQLGSSVVTSAGASDIFLAKFSE